MSDGGLHRLEKNCTATFDYEYKYQPFQPFVCQLLICVYLFSITGIRMDVWPIVCCRIVAQLSYYHSYCRRFSASQHISYSRSMRKSSGRTIIHIQLRITSIQRRIRHYIGNVFILYVCLESKYSVCQQP